MTKRDKHSKKPKRETLAETLAEDALQRSTPEYKRFERVSEIWRLLGPVETLLEALSPAGLGGAKLSEGQAWQLSRLARERVSRATELAQCEHERAWHEYEAKHAPIAKARRT